MIDLIKIHAIMTSKGYHYFEGHTNTRTNCVYYSFSKTFCGKGPNFDIIIEDDSVQIEHNVTELEITVSNIRYESVIDFLIQNVK
jgi:hypothetical protein